MSVGLASPAVVARVDAERVAVLEAEDDAPVGAHRHGPEAGEVSVVTPACFEAFAAGRDLAAATVRNRVVRVGRHRVRALRSGAANLFRAVLADGRRGEGTVFPGPLLWDDHPPPRANAEVVRKRR